MLNAVAISRSSTESARDFLKFARRKQQLSTKERRNMKDSREIRRSSKK